MANFLDYEQEKAEEYEEDYQDHLLEQPDFTVDATGAKMTVVEDKYNKIVEITPVFKRKISMKLRVHSANQFVFFSCYPHCDVYLYSQEDGTGLQAKVMIESTIPENPESTNPSFLMPCKMHVIPAGLLYRGIDRSDSLAGIANVFQVTFTNPDTKDYYTIKCWYDVTGGTLLRDEMSIRLDQPQNRPLEIIKEIHHYNSNGCYQYDFTLDDKDGKEDKTYSAVIYPKGIYAGCDFIHEGTEFHIRRYKKGVVISRGIISRIAHIPEENEFTRNLKQHAAEVVQFRSMINRYASL